MSNAFMAICFGLKSCFVCIVQLLFLKFAISSVKKAKRLLKVFA
jgi:hypothetical protein